jgi:hypothetical protein
MLLKSFELGVSYSFIAVQNLDFPMNDWREKHVLQGFTWRPESVSFGMLNSCTKCSVDVWIKKELSINPETVRAIQVPFTVSSPDGIVFRDVGDELDVNLINLPEGVYSLIFETGFKEEYRDTPDYQGRLVVLLPTWCRFTFIQKEPHEKVEAEILRTDQNLSPLYPLLMEADPA